MKKEKNVLNKETVFIYLFIFLGGALRALYISLFILPNDFAPGGVTGIATMLDYSTGINSGYFLLMLNIPLILIGAFFLGKKFALRTAFSSLTTSLLLVLIQLLDSSGYSIGSITFLKTHEPLLAALASGVLSGMSLAILIRCGASTGGSDILASILNKKRPDMRIGTFIFMIDAAVVAVSIFVYNNGLDPALYSLVMIFVSTTICNTILAGAKSAEKFEIITKEPEKVIRQIQAELNRSVTILPAKGTYSQEDRSLLICIVKKSEIPAMQKIIRNNPETFCYVSSTSDVYGSFFKGN